MVHVRRLVCSIAAVLFSALVTVGAYWGTIAITPLGREIGPFGSLMVSFVTIAFVPHVALFIFIIALPFGWGLAILKVWPSKPLPRQKIVPPNVAKPTSA